MNLNNDIRASIAKNILEYSFGKRQASLERRVGKLADAIYRDVMGKYKIQLSQVPERFIRKNRYMHLYLGTDYVSLSFAEYNPFERYPKPGDVVDRPWDSDKRIRFSGNHKFTERWRALLAGFARVEEERVAMRAEVVASLAAVRTVEKLSLQWPGARKFYPAALETYKPPVPAKIPANDLDSMIKAAHATPVEKEA